MQRAASAFLKKFQQAKLFENCSWGFTYDEAIDELKQAAILQPQVALPYVYLCSCYDTKNDARMTLKYADDADRCFDAAHVPISEAHRLFALDLRAVAYEKTGNHDLAIST